MTLAQRGGRRKRRAAHPGGRSGVRQVGALASVFVLPAMLLLSAAASAQRAELTAGDRAEIERLSSRYLQAFGACDAEAEAGLNAGDMLAINRLGGAELAEYYEAEQGGMPRLMTVGTRISVVGGEVRGRVFLPAGGYRDEAYRKTAAGEWRVTSAPAPAPPPR